ncbi:periplasmic binding protein-like I [Catenaria anguillulae PL171]|uniref:Periplasmic binding protein-like I n=1 Tax=Catenaria anguillulae PL171 TaxID=765915 RepID=A0A1Y2HRM9_9FUNG|nr:periplasmic binding protein-like I [Catenaria anguillulae PL171]
MNLQFTILSCILLAAGNGAVGILGESSSDNSKRVASIGGVVNVPQCSPFSSSSDLSDKIRYPTFFRTVVTGSTLAVCLKQIMDAFKWKRIGVLSESGNNFLETITQEFVALTTNNVTEVTTQYVVAPTYSPSLVTLPADWLKKLTETDTRILAIFHVTSAAPALIFKLHESGWLTSNKVLITVNNLMAQMCEINLAQCKQIAATVPIFFVDPKTKDLELFSAKQARYKLENNGTAYPFPKAEGLSTNQTTGMTNLTKLSMYTTDVFQTVPSNLAYFNVTTDMGAPQQYIIDRNGDAVFSQYQLLGVKPVDSPPSSNGSTPSHSLTFTTHYLLANNGTVQPVSPFPFVGGAPPLDGPVRELVNPQWSSPSGIILAVLGALTVVLVVVCTAVFIRHRSHPEVKATSLFASMLVNFAAGIGLWAMSTYVGTPDNTQCHLRFWTQVLSYGTILAATLPKTYRVYKLLYSTVGGSHTSRWYMAAFSAAILLCEVGGLIVYSLVAKPKAEAQDLGLAQKQVACIPEKEDDARYGVAPLVVINVLFVLWGLYLTFFTRKVNSKYNESKRIAACTYNTAIVMVCLAVLTNNLATLYFFSALLVWYLVTMAVIILHVPSLSRILGSVKTEDSSHDFFSRVSVTASAVSGGAAAPGSRNGGSSNGGGGGNMGNGPTSSAGGESRASLAIGGQAGGGAKGSKYLMFEVEIMPVRMLWFLARWERMDLWYIAYNQDAILQFFEPAQRKDKLNYGGSFTSFELVNADLGPYNDECTVMLRGIASYSTFYVRFTTPAAKDKFQGLFSTSQLLEPSPLDS